jgi:hypothetical protein
MGIAGRFTEGGLYDGLLDKHDMNPMITLPYGEAMALVEAGRAAGEVAAATVFAGALRPALLRHGESARVGVATQGAGIMATFKTKASTSECRNLQPIYP